MDKNIPVGRSRNVIAAIPNKTISNAITGQDITFLQTGRETNGQLLEMEATYNVHSKEPAPHCHPYQTEDFTVLSGEMTVRLHGQLRVLKQGDTLHIPKNTEHSMWNHTDQRAVVHWKVQPAMETDHFLENFTGLANDGKTNATGMPNLLQIALLANRYAHVVRLSKPPFAVQKILFSILSPIARLAGYQSSYEKYID